MIKYFKYIILALVVSPLFVSCADDMDDNATAGSEIKNFVWRGMNAFYLYKPEIDVLADDRFASTQELEAFHSQFETPEDFFESLLFDPSRVDRFSVIVSDYIELENRLTGNTRTNGMKFGLVAESGSATNVFGYVRYVLPGSSADNQGVERGQLFNRINGTRLTRSNFSNLLANDVYTIGLASLNNGTTTAIDTEITLTKTVIQEDPIFIAKVIEQEDQKVGYLMYNSFLADFDAQLNDAFGEFKSQGVTHLVLDLRYNGGGRVSSAIALGSLISGNPTTDVFSTEEWNPDIQQILEDTDPERLINNFVDEIADSSAFNSLNLSSLHVITTGSSASASELVINSLEPYIDVTQVGTTTAGKFQASVTLYDTEDFTRPQANPANRYALQPLVLKSLNVDGNTDYVEGLFPDIDRREDFNNLGVLGDPNEPLLKLCLDDISLGGVIESSVSKSTMDLKEISGSNELEFLGNEMWKVLPQD